MAAIQFLVVATKRIVVSNFWMGHVTAVPTVAGAGKLGGRRL